MTTFQTPETQASTLSLGDRTAAFLTQMALIGRNAAVSTAEAGGNKPDRLTYLGIREQHFTRPGIVETHDHINVSGITATDTYVNRGRQYDDSTVQVTVDSIPCSLSTRRGSRVAHLILGEASYATPEEVNAAQIIGSLVTVQALRNVAARTGGELSDHDAIPYGTARTLLDEWSAQDTWGVKRVMLETASRGYSLPRLPQSPVVTPQQ